MNVKKGLLIAAGLLVLGLALGGGAYALSNDDGGERPAAVQDEDAPGGDGGAVSAVCAPGHPDCVDTIVDGEGGGFATCLEGATDCADFPEGAGDKQKCIPDTECVEPGPADCPQGIAVGECDPNAGGECYEILPLPVEEDGATVTVVPGPTPFACDPPEPGRCEDTERCLPPDCAVSSDGSVACPDAPPPSEGEGSGSSEPGSSGGAEAEPAVVDPLHVE
ncbi:MAG: hypothetical protein WEC75_02080 [Dehalococcoidia bacterium]